MFCCLELDRATISSQKLELGYLIFRLFYFVVFSEALSHYCNYYNTHVQKVDAYEELKPTNSKKRMGYIGLSKYEPESNSPSDEKYTWSMAPISVE